MRYFLKQYIAIVTVFVEMLSNVISPQSLVDSQKSSSSAIIEYPASDSQMSASQNSQYPSSLELFSQSGSACSAPLPIAHLTKSQCKPTSDLSSHPRMKKDKKYYMKYLSAGPLSDTVNGMNQGGSSQPAITIGPVSKSNFENWKTEKANNQIIQNLESTMKIILDNTNELAKSVCALQTSLHKSNEQQSSKLQSLSTQADIGFSSVHEKFKELKSEENNNGLLINKLLNEISELKKDIAKKDKHVEELRKEIVELKSGKILTESMKKTFQLILREFFTAETLKLFGNQRPSQATPHNNETPKGCSNDGEQVLEAHNCQSTETIPLTCHEQVPVVPDISSHQQIPAHNGQICNSSFNSPASEWASDFSKSSGQKRTYSQRITISRKISPTLSPMVSAGQREYGTWGGDTSSSDHDTIEVTQLASFTRKVRRKPKTNLIEEQNHNSALCGPWQQEFGTKQKRSTRSTQAVVPVGRFKRSIEARKRRILCDSNDAELLQISASIRQQQMNKQLKL